MKLRSLSSALVLLTAAVASADYTLTSSYEYALTEDVGTAYIRDLEFIMNGGFADASGGWGLTTSFFNNLGDDGTQGSNSGSLTATAAFGPGFAEPFLSESLFFGIIRGLPQDILDNNPDQKHLVLFMDPIAASNVDDIAFGTVFPTTNEDALIDAIEYVHGDHTDAEKAPYYNDFIYPFYDAARNAHAGSGPEPQRSIYIRPNSDFSIVLFSDGQIVGSGTSSYQAVPEPASLLALGAGGLALLRRRRR